MNKNMFHLKRLLLLSLVCGLYGCATVEPWQRDILADPIMQLSTSSMSDLYEQHMHRALSQGLTGIPAAGGGCGCEQ